MARIVDHPSSSALFHRDQRATLPVLDRAEGVFLWDREGRRYFDATGGAFVVTIGHAVPEIIDAIRRQLGIASYIGSNWTSDAAVDLATRIAELAPDGLEKVVFASGGSEANEVALKLARQYFVERGQTSKWKVLCRRGGYHGNTIATLSMSARDDWKSDYAPYLLAFEAIPGNVPYHCTYCGANGGGCDLRCADALEQAILAQGPETVAAFIAEPVVSRGVVPPPAYWQQIREVCDRYDVLLIADEVITGFGRTGRHFAMEHFDVTPDIITCGKGMASGYATISGAVLHERVAKAIASGSGRHSQGYTFSGNPLACATALAVMDYIRERDLVEQSRLRGAQLSERVERLRGLPGVGDVRGGFGLLASVEFVSDAEHRTPDPALATAAWQQAAERGVAMYHLTIGGLNTLALAPPFVITEAQLDEMMDRFEEAVIAAADGSGARAA
jgi:adenosylmethionine-8-amino-7-oxononanoate aminotransferase